MKIIGHRGSRGTELENSLASFRAAVKLKIDGFEFDIHRTLDGQLVVMHDDTTGRTANKKLRINDATFAQLQKIQLKNGQPIPTPAEIFDIAGDFPIYLDIKDSGCADKIVELLRAYPAAKVTLVSFRPAELERVRKLLPDAPTYIYFLKKKLQTRPIHMVRVALQIHATGIAIDKVAMNPLTYFLARSKGLKMYSYSIGSIHLARLYHWLYPELDLCTSQPERLVRLFKSIK